MRIKYLGKKGYSALQMTILRELSSEERPVAGAVINEAKGQVQQALNARKVELENVVLSACLAAETTDVSLPGRRVRDDGLRPVTRTIDRTESFFGELDSTVAARPEIGDDYHDFDALNIPGHHPVRADHDTFRFDITRLPYTQTSGMQIRIMKAQQPLIRITVPSHVYHNDYDRTHIPMPHQIEGLVVDTNVSFTNLRGTLHDFPRNSFRGDSQICFRPFYFPPTESSAKVDVIGKNGKWLEVLGCGMVHPNVLRNVGTDPEVYSGFTFGTEMECLTMLCYGVTGLHPLFENDLRLFKQFK